MYKEKNVVVVVPAYNEETQISIVVETMPDFVDTIVIVDDKSKDSTVEVVKQLQKNHARVILLCHEANQGVGGAIASGYKWARDNGADIAVVMAGDGQMAPADLPALLDPVADDTVDYSKGNRLVYEEAYKLIPKTRFFGNVVLSYLTKIASGYWNIADSQTGYTAIGKRALHAIDWDSMYKRYGQPNDLLVRLNVLDMAVRDVPVRPVYNVGEKSGIKIHKVIFTISFLLLRLFYWRIWKKYVIRDAHPLALFSAYGTFLLLLSLIFLLRILIFWPIEGSVPVMSALAMMFSFGLGFQSFFFGLWLDMDKNRWLNQG
jgi:glycosyltransferase involved in cell wall biosynthesis